MAVLPEFFQPPSAAATEKYFMICHSMLAEGTRLPNATFSTNPVASYIFPDSSHAMYSQEFLRPQNSQALRISTFAQNSVRLPRLTDALSIFSSREGES